MRNRKLINPKTGEKKITIDRSKSDNGGSMTVRDMIFLTNLQIKRISRA